MTYTYVGKYYTHYTPVAICELRGWLGDPAIYVLGMYHNNIHNYTQLCCICTLTTPINMIHARLQWRRGAHQPPGGQRGAEGRLGCELWRI
jgi:hypothetical protein